MKIRFKTIKKENEIVAYMESVRGNETLTNQEKESYIIDLTNEYEKNGFIRVVR